MLFISFYTKNTGYEKEVENLRDSLEKLSLKYDIYGINSLGSWQKNCQYKPQFIMNMLMKHRCDDKVIWTDADSIIRKKPILFENIQADIAFHYCKSHWYKYPELLTGTMLFRNNTRVFKFLDDWIESCIKNPEIWEQKALQKIIKSSIKKHELSFYELPSSYVKIYDLDENGEKNIDPVIEHFQANRKYKNNI